MPRVVSEHRAAPTDRRRSPRALRSRDGNRRAGGTAVSLAKQSSTNEVIVLSSDTEDEDVPLRALPKRKKKATKDETVRERATARGVARTGSAEDVTAISRAESSAQAQLRSEIEKLKQELVLEKQSKTALQAELVKAKARSLEEKSTDLVSDLEDCTLCEICTIRMWSPATLVECGHTFCQSCLRDWFDTKLTKHIEQYPHYLAGPQIPQHYHDRRNDPRVRELIKTIKEAFRQSVPSPVYTCPACRTVVRSKPVEIFAMKEVVNKVAKAAGDEVPDAPAQNRAARKDIGGAWDGYFKR